MLRSWNIPTPELIGFALYPAGAGLVRVDVATAFIPDSYDLGMVLSNMGPDISRAEALDAVIALLVQLTAHGFTHRDLNVKNILLYREHVRLIAAVLDVDVMRWSVDEAPATTMLTNVSRLARSMKKARSQFGILLAESELSAFVERALSATPVRAVEAIQGVFATIRRDSR